MTAMSRMSGSRASSCTVDRAELLCVYSFVEFYESKLFCLELCRYSVVQVCESLVSFAHLVHIQPESRSRR